MTEAERKNGELQNSLNVVIATPFGLSVLLPPEVWTAMGIGLNRIKP
jgi:hypothetical protein